MYEGRKTALQIADELLDQDIVQLLDWWCARLMELSRYQLASQPLQSEIWHSFKALPSKLVMHTLQRGLELRASFARGVALNKRLILETLFLEWMALCQNRAAS
jgi:DNA polymerase-3 subunit delta'